MLVAHSLLRCAVLVHVEEFCCVSLVVCDCATDRVGWHMKRGRDRRPLYCFCTVDKSSKTEKQQQVSCTKTPVRLRSSSFQTLAKYVRVNKLYTAAGIRDDLSDIWYHSNSRLRRCSWTAASSLVIPTRSPPPDPRAATVMAVTATLLSGAW